MPVDYDVVGQCFIVGKLKLPAPIQPYGHVKLFDALKYTCHSDLERIAKSLDLPMHGCVGTLDLMNAVASTLQYLWYQQLSPARTVPDHVAANHQARMERWENLVNQLKEGVIVEKKADGAATAAASKPAEPKANEPKAPKAPPAPKVTYTYQLIEANVAASKRAAVLNNKDSHNHDSMIVRALQGVKAPVSLEVVVDKVKAMGGYTTKDPLATSVRWHLNKLEKEALVKAIPNEVPAPASAAA